MTQQTKLFTNEFTMEDDKFRFSYGPVMIVEGEYKGQIGFFDDEAINEDNDEFEAIVYLNSVPFISEYVLIPFNHIAPVSIDFLTQEQTTERSQYESAK